jgi:hypothetical protein
MRLAELRSLAAGERQLVELATSLAELQARPVEVRAAVRRVLAELLVLSETRRRR